MHNQSILLNVFDYFRHPIYSQKNEKESIRKKLFSVLLLISLVYIVIFFIYLPINVMFGSGVKNSLQNYVPTNDLFFILFFVPLFEEILFRLPLRFNKWTAILWEFLYFSYVIPFMILLFPKFIADIPQIQLVLAIICTYFVSMFVFLRNDAVHTFFVKHFRWILYGLVLLFGLLHFTNFTSFQGFPAILLPVLVLPQTIVGAFLAYIRMHLGFWYGYLFHFSYNFILTIPDIALPQRHLPLSSFLNQLFPISVLAFLILGFVTLIQAIIIAKNRRKIIQQHVEALD